MDEAETQAAIDAAIAETGAAGTEGHGQGHRGPEGRRMPGRMDFGKASGLVKAALGEGLRRERAGVSPAIPRLVRRDLDRRDLYRSGAL